MCGSRVQQGGRALKGTEGDGLRCKKLRIMYGRDRLTFAPSRATPRRLLPVCRQGDDGGRGRRCCDWRASDRMPRRSPPLGRMPRAPVRPQQEGEGGRGHGTGIHRTTLDSYLIHESPYALRLSRGGFRGVLRASKAASISDMILLIPVSGATSPTVVSSSSLMLCVTGAATCFSSTLT